LPKRQVSQSDRADADALEAADAQADQLAHAPDLALSSLAEHEAQLIIVQPFDLGRLELAVVEAEAVIQQRQAPVVKLAFDTNQILLVDAALLTDQLARHAPILSQHQQAGRIDIQAAGRRQSLQA
jgi:hypothetical protein